jgi:Helix-turn-helix.
MGTLTEYGKTLRHLRLDKSELLGTMAAKLGLSPAYLSSIETGNRSIPSDLTGKILSLYNLSEEEAQTLLKAEADTNHALTINLADASEEQIDASVLFAREIKNMTVSELRILYKQLQEVKNGLSDN